MHNSSNPFAIGIDLGTGSCKAILLSAAGDILGQAAAPYPSTDLTSRWQEQDADGLLMGAILSVREAIAASGREPFNCLGLSIGGALHSLTAIDQNDRPLLGVLTWADDRAAPQAARMRAEGLSSAFYQQTGCPAHALYPYFKIQWLRETQPELFERAACFISAKEYVLLKLTGHRAIDYSIAGASGLLNTHTLSWDEKILSQAGIRADQLATLVDPREKVGTLLAEMASQMGLPAGTPVYMGSSDAVNSSLGAGTVAPHQVTCMVGTSGAIRTISPRPVLDPHERTWCYAIDSSHWLIGGAINNGGLAVQWMRDALATGLPVGSRLPDLNQIMGWAAAVEPGADGVICLPFFAGERSPRWNPNVSGVFFGLHLHHDQRHMCRALLEGIAFRLRSVMEALDETMPGLTEVRASGGFVQSPVWLQITADILNRPLHIPVSKDTSAVAAAMWVLLGSGKIGQLEDLGGFTPLTAASEPKPENKAVYDRQYKTYWQLYDALKPVFSDTARNSL